MVRGRDLSTGAAPHQARCTPYGLNLFLRPGAVPDSRWQQAKEGQAGYRLPTSKYCSIEMLMIYKHTVWHCVSATRLVRVTWAALSRGSELFKVECSLLYNFRSVRPYPINIAILSCVLQMEITTWKLPRFPTDRQNACTSPISSRQRSPLCGAWWA